MSAEQAADLHGFVRLDTLRQWRQVFYDPATLDEPDGALDVIAEQLDDLLVSFPLGQNYSTVDGLATFEAKAHIVESLSVNPSSVICRFSAILIRHCRYPDVPAGLKEDYTVAIDCCYGDTRLYGSTYYLARYRDADSLDVLWRPDSSTEGIGASTTPASHEIWTRATEYDATVFFDDLCRLEKCLPAAQRLISATVGYQTVV